MPADRPKETCFNSIVVVLFARKETAAEKDEQVNPNVYLRLVNKYKLRQDSVTRAARFLSRYRCRIWTRLWLTIRRCSYLWTNLDSSLYTDHRRHLRLRGKRFVHF